MDKNTIPKTADGKPDKETMAKLQNDPESVFFTPQQEMSVDQKAEYTFDMQRIVQIAEVRESALPQFDGMGYLRYNETNEMADMSYLAPKKNKGDSRITTGITHEKDSSLVAFYLNLNFEGNVRIFYKDREETEAGTALTKLVRKSRELENYDGKRAYLYRNYTVQGTAFAEETYNEIWVPDKQIIGEPDPLNLSDVKWIDNGFKRVMSGCQVNLVDGKKVYMENMREPDIQKQPGLYTVEYVPREILKAIWGNTENWKYVPYYINPVSESLGAITSGSIYSDWIWGQIDFYKCCVIKVWRPLEQRYQMYINNVAMLPAKYPLKAISPAGIINIAKGDSDQMNMFAYSKSEPAKTKIDQAVFDEILQNMLIKQRQSVAVPRGNMSKFLVPDSLFLGGRVLNNIDPKKLPPLIDNPGITQSDFSFYELFKEHIDSKTISSLLEGNASETSSGTLGEYMDQQKKALLKLGGKIDGIIQWEKQMLRLRVMNLLQHAYQKDEEGNYRDISMEDSTFDGQKGMNVIKFNDNNYRTSNMVEGEEDQYSQENQTDIAYTYLNPKMMRDMIDNPDYYFCYEVVPVDKNNDKLTQMVFVSMITQAANLFGMDSLQVDRLKKRYAAVMGQMYDDLFLSPEQQAQKQLQMQQAAMEQEAAAKGSVPSPVAPQATQQLGVEPMFQ